MGIACGALCSRDHDKKNPEEAYLAELAFYQHMDDTRSQSSVRKTAGLMTISQLDEVMSSACNYWTNKSQFKVSGNNRPMFSYTLQNRQHLLKIDNSVFTQQERICAQKIQRWWRRVGRKRNHRKSRSYQNVFYR